MTADPDAPRFESNLLYLFGILAQKLSELENFKGFQLGLISQILHEKFCMKIHA
ncbi:MAG: hypothetical protein P4M14_05575 [Gammaproteobacteria bacterium]|nr:hypothetical protein [Gammaproteobacteria bacterium]